MIVGSIGIVTMYFGVV